MPVAKKTTPLDVSVIIPASSGIYTGVSIEQPYGWAKMIFVKITNSAFILSTPAIAIIEVSNDNINYYTFRTLVGNLNPSEEASSAFIIQLPAIYIRVTYVAGDQDVTINSEITEVTEQAHSTRDLNTQNKITLSNTTETTLLAANADFFLDITDLIISNTSGTSTTIDLRDSTAGTIRFSVDLEPLQTEIVNFSALLTQATLNNNWTAQSNITATDVIITALAQLNT